MIAEGVPLRIVERGKPFTGTCEFMDDCPDIAKLRDESNGREK